MKVLLDTHVWLWSLGDPSRLSKEAKRIFGSHRNVIHLSAASAWEMAIKVTDVIAA